MPLLGFNPAAPSNTPGICTLCENWIPSDAGMEAAPSILDVGADALAAAANGAFLGTKLDASNRLFAGTDTKIYEKTSATAWTDRSVGGGSYTTGSLWSFCQFGDTTIASNYLEAIQASASGAFAALTAPKAKIVESVVTGAGGFVFAFNTVDATHGTGTSPDRWWCSALNDHTSWVPAAATQCTTGRLIGGGGPIIAAKRFGADSIVAYKGTSMFHGRYTGGDAVWGSWQEYPEVGAAGLRAVCDIGFAHFIVGPTGFWLYDGARPNRIGAEVREWFAANIDYEHIGKTEAIYDQATNRVFVFFRKVGGSGLNAALVWHVGTNQWGVASYAIETTLQYVAPGTTFDADTGTFDSDATTFDEAPVAKKLPAVINTSHKLGALTGTALASSFQTADIGDVAKASRLTEAYLSYATRPASASCESYASSMLGGTELVGPTSTAYDIPGSSNTPGRFTLRSHARWHRLEFSFTGPVRVTDYGAKIVPSGSR